MYGEDGAGERGVRAQHSLDLAQFDPVAADLDLAVGPAEEEQPPFLVAAHQVAGAEPASAADRTDRVTGEALGGQVGPLPVALGDTRPADPQLARLPRCGGR